MIATAPIVLVSMLLVAGAPDGVAPVTTGGDPCALLEGLPTASAPIRSAKSMRAAFKTLDRAGSNPAKLGRAHDALAAALSELLRASRTIFHPAGVPFRDWKPKHRKKARSFLERHVRGKGAVLRVGVAGFEPQPPLSAALQWTACRSGRQEAAIAYGRRATLADEGPARAFAALLLLHASRRDEAMELAPRLTGESFLVSWVLAELATDPDERRRRHAEAGRRVTTPSQHTAWEEQTTRLHLEIP